MKYCSNCGKELSEGSKFCTNCGKSTEKVNKPMKKTNGACLAGFIASFFLTITPIILGIIGISQVNKNTDEDGKGLAIAGIIIAVLKVITIGSLIAFIMAFAKEWGAYEPSTYIDRCSKAICDCEPGTEDCECTYKDVLGNEYTIYCDVNFERA